MNDIRGHTPGRQPDAAPRPPPPWTDLNNIPVVASSDDTATITHHLAALEFDLGD
jgi:hypothetical protein